MLNKLKKRKIKSAILIISGFVVLGLVGFGLIGYYAQEKEIPEIEAPKPEIKVSSFIGKIIEIKDKEIKIQISVAQNQGIEQDNMILTISITPETKFIEKDEILEKKKEIAFSDLKISDQVIAIAQENIAWQKEFIAQSILRIKLADVK